jgi:hypothetical protein
MIRSRWLKEGRNLLNKINVEINFLKRWRFTCVTLALLFCSALPAMAILQNPDRSQVEQALNRGKESGRQHHPPNELYWNFGSTTPFEPHGFLVTKISALAVMSGHFALRGEQPTDQDIQRVVEEDVLQVVVNVFGHSPGLARESYLLIQQGNQLVKPDRIRFDARAQAVGQRQGSRIFRAKIVAVFSYNSIDLEGRTTLLFFPGAGGEVTFDLDFSAIP